MCSLGARQLTNTAYVAVFKTPSPGKLGSTQTSFRLSVHGRPPALSELERALGELPEDQRQVVLLVGLEGMSYETTAAVLPMVDGQSALDATMAFFEKPLRFRGLLALADEDDVASAYAMRTWRKPRGRYEGSAPHARAKRRVTPQQRFEALFCSKDLIARAPAGIARARRGGAGTTFPRSRRPPGEGGHVETRDQPHAPRKNPTRRAALRRLSAINV